MGNCAIIQKDSQFRAISHLCHMFLTDLFVYFSYCQQEHLKSGTKLQSGCRDPQAFNSEVALEGVTTCGHGLDFELLSKICSFR